MLKQPWFIEVLSKMSKAVFNEARQGLLDHILTVCENSPGGVSDGDIVSKLAADSRPEDRTGVYNELLKAGRLRLEQRSTEVSGAKKTTFVYVWQSAENAEKFKGLDASERMVYDIIERAKQEGETKRELKFKTNIRNSTELKQIVERLVTRGLIKEIKSVQGTNKKVYIAAEYEPSTTHTGGAWYNDEQEFDTEFVDAIYDTALKYIQETSYVTVQDVASHIAELQISVEALAQADIKQLMMTMLYDSVIEECDGAGDGKDYFRSTQPTPARDNLAAIPCGPCPLFHDCTPGGVISPQTCVYMTEWLEAASDW